MLTKVKLAHGLALKLRHVWEYPKVCVAGGAGFKALVVVPHLWLHRSKGPKVSGIPSAGPT